MLYRFIFTDGPDSDTLGDILEVSAPTLRHAWADVCAALDILPLTPGGYPARVEWEAR